jgi:hypothetical protein
LDVSSGVDRIIVVVGLLAAEELRFWKLDWCAAQGICWKGMGGGRGRNRYGWVGSGRDSVIHVLLLL